MNGAAEAHWDSQVEREIKIHSQLFHQNIVSLFAAFEDADHVYLAQEYAAGALTTITHFCVLLRLAGRSSTFSSLSERSKPCTLRAGGDLYEALKLSGGQISERRAVRDVIRPCLSALIYLHAKVALLPCWLPRCLVPSASRDHGLVNQLLPMQGIIHRDVKVRVQLSCSYSWFPPDAIVNQGPALSLCGCAAGEHPADVRQDCQSGRCNSPSFGSQP